MSRNYNNRYRPRGRRRSSRQREEPGLGDWLGSFIARAIRGLFRKMFSRRPAEPRGASMNRRLAVVLPPPLPLADRWAAVERVDRSASFAQPAALPYKKCRELLSQGERAVWHPLFRAVKGKYRLFCKVRLADVICCPKTHRDERYWFRKIGRYHVDFVLCDPHTTAPLLVIELDDRSHRRHPRKGRDHFKDEVLRAAGMSVYRIPARQAYDPIELRANIERLIHPQPTPPSQGQ